MSFLLSALRELWPIVATLLFLATSAAASAHAILTKREVRAAIGWAGLAWLSPFVGPLLYVVLGINRIERRARRLSIRPVPPEQTLATVQYLAEEAVAALGYDPALIALSGAIAGEELTLGNRIDPLVDGDEAYPAMLDAIASAERTVGLCSYIFERDGPGEAFIDALADAHGRGVAVRVLMDAVGARYSRPPTPRLLAERGVPVARFLAGAMPWRMPYVNLRNHRKILVVDGRVGFTGGMNIRAGCVLRDEPENPTRDVHFRLEGPVVGQIAEVFARDWSFVTGESLEGDRWFPEPIDSGDCAARVIPDGPDDDFERIYEAVLVAINTARESIRIVTPYFLPEEPHIRALQLAAKAGRRVEIVLPLKNNLRLVQWAMNAHLEQLMVPGITIWLTPPPFDHTKLLLVDDVWSMFGSANLDARSLRLNFEMNVSSLDPPLARRLAGLVDERIAAAHRLEARDLRARGLATRLRDGTVRLFLPYL